jgi:hypothetical protein
MQTAEYAELAEKARKVIANTAARGDTCEMQTAEQAERPAQHVGVFDSGRPRPSRDTI